MMATIGIFWVFDGSVFGERTELSDASQTLQGLFDSDAAHVSSWEQHPYVKSHLAGYEYQHVPRGRVLYQSRQQRFLVFLDAQLMTAKTKAAIAGYFGFSPKQADWRSDLHYTTEADAIERLLKD